MRLDQHIGYGDLIPQVGSFAAMARIFVGAQIVPRPAVERAVAHARDEVRDEVVAKIVALVGGAPEVAGLRMHGEPDAVPEPGCEHAPISSVRIEDEHSRAIGVRALGAAETVRRLPARDRGGIAFTHALAVIRRRSDRDEHLPAIGRKTDVARNVAALHCTPARAGEIAHDHLVLSSRLEYAAAAVIAGHASWLVDI